MYQVLIEFLQFFGIYQTTPQTVGEFLVWFTMVIASLAMLKFVLRLFFELVSTVAGGGRR